MRLVEVGGALVPTEFETLAELEAVVIEQAAAVAFSFAADHRTRYMPVAGSACHAPTGPQVLQLSEWYTSDSQQAALLVQVRAHWQAPEHSAILPLPPCRPQQACQQELAWALPLISSVVSELAELPELALSRSLLEGPR